MGLGKKIVDIMQQAKTIQKAKEGEASVQSSAAATTEKKLPMSKRGKRSLQNKGKLNNQSTLLGG